MVLGFFPKEGSYLQGRSVRKLQMALMVIGVFGLLLGSLLGIWPGLLGTLSLLAWTAGQAGSQAWEAWKGDREMAIRFLGKLSSMPAWHSKYSEHIGLTCCAKAKWATVCIPLYDMPSRKACCVRVQVRRGQQ